MAVVRAFIAIEFPKEIYARLEDVSSQLRKRIPGGAVRWVPVQNIHLTLKFLGDVSIANLEVLKKMLASESRNHPPFELSIGDLGAFPSPRRPRVIWVGIQAPPDLAALQHSLESETARLGYAAEDRPFSPHLTLGRVSRNATPEDTHKIGEVLSAYHPGFLGVATVQAVHLFKSDLRPDGAIYSKLDTAPLAR